jgi:hypothetical protein
MPTTDTRTDTRDKDDAARASQDPAVREEERRAAAARKAQEDAARAAEGRKLVHERDIERREHEYKMGEASITAEQEAAAKQAEDYERLSRLTPEERAAEISPFAASVPHFTVLNEPHHSAEFILSEANGQRSRGAAYFADPATIYVGMPVKFTAAATATQPATYVPAAAGADCTALCIYAGGTIPGEGLRTAVIVRDAEVNGKLISWGAITAPEQAIGITTLAAAGIIVR